VAQRPAQAEQIRFDGLVRPHDSSLILPVRVGLVSQQESRAGDDAAGAGIQGGARIGGGGDAAGQKHRTLPGRPQGMGQEVQGRHGSDEVPAGLASLGDQTVRAPGDRGERLRFGADHHEDEDPGVTQVRDEPAPFAERQHDGVHAGVNADSDVVATDEGHQQVYRDRAPGRPLAHLVDRRS
jgi:hypothetical protein